MLEGKKISELDQIDTLSLGSSFPVLDKGATKRIAFSALLNKIENELPESDIDKVKDDVEKLKVKTESINTLTTEMEAVKDQVSGVDEMVQGQNATIRNCVSTVEGLEQVIETTHFDDVLALEEQVRANTTNIEKKLNKTTDSANAGKAVVVDENGNLVFGAAGVQVSKAEGNAIEEKEDGIYVAPLPEGLSGIPIGASILWTSENIPAGFLKYDGTIYNKSDYPVLFTRIPNKWKISEEQFRIPNFKNRVAQGADGNLGELIEAGLPNIEGRFRHTTTGGGGSEVDGAFSNFTISGVQTNSGGQYTGNGVKFDASKFNAIYGNSDTVQPPAVALYYIIKATDYTTVQEDVLDDSKATTGNVWSASKVKSEIENKHKYSTDEIIVGKWIDGKPIYRKVLDVRTNGLGVTGFSINISDLNIDYLVNSNVLGSGNNNYSGNKWVISCVTSSGTRELYLEGATQNLRGKSNEYMQFAILEYTKTTD